MQTAEFNLQPALAFKQRLEDICQMELAEIEVAHARERQFLEMLVEQEIRGCQEIEHRQLSGHLDVASIRLGFGDLQAIEKRIEQQLRVLGELAERRRLKQARLLEIAKERKALEKLKEKHEKRMASAVARSENKIMADIALTQYRRQGVG